MRTETSDCFTPCFAHAWLLPHAPDSSTAGTLKAALPMVGPRLENASHGFTSEREAGFVVQTPFLASCARRRGQTLFRLIFEFGAVIVCARRRVVFREGQARRQYARGRRGASLLSPCLALALAPSPRPLPGGREVSSQRAVPAAPILAGLSARRATTAPSGHQFWRDSVRLAWRAPRHDSVTHSPGRWLKVA